MLAKSHTKVSFGCIADGVSLLLFSACLERHRGLEHDPLFSRCRHFELACFFQFISGDRAIGPEPVLSLAGVQERHVRREAFAGAAAFAASGGDFRRASLR